MTYNKVKSKKIHLLSHLVVLQRSALKLKLWMHQRPWNFFESDKWFQQLYLKLYYCKNKIVFNLWQSMFPRNCPGGGGANNTNRANLFIKNCATTRQQPILAHKIKNVMYIKAAIDELVNSTVYSTQGFLDFVPSHVLFGCSPTNLRPSKI